MESMNDRVERLFRSPEWKEQMRRARECQAFWYRHFQREPASLQWAMAEQSRTNALDRGRGQRSEK
mgnify:FL=1